LPEYGNSHFGGREAARSSGNIALDGDGLKSHGLVTEKQLARHARSFMRASHRVGTGRATANPARVNHQPEPPVSAT